MKFLIALSIGIVFLGCSGPKHLSKEYWSSHHLKNYIGPKSEPSKEFIIADSLLKVSQAYSKQEELVDAVWAAKFSHLYYRIGLMKEELINSENEKKKLKRDVDKENEHLNSLKEVFQEIQSMRKP